MHFTTPPETPTPRRSGSPTIGICVIVVIVLAHFGSTFAYWRFFASSQELEPPDLSNRAETVVLISNQSLKTANRKLEVELSVIPRTRWWTLASTFWPPTSRYRSTRGTPPESGREGPARHPFISADVMTGSGDEREFASARVEFEG